MASPTPKPTSPFQKPKKATGKKAASPFLKPGQTAPKQDPWAPVLSFGQSVIDTLSTPLYGVEGTINALLKGKNPVEAVQAGADNATAWTRGKRPVTGSELLKTAGIESNFWSSLAADVLLDPLTYTPGVLFTAPLKAAGIAGKAAIKAGTQAAIKGERVAKAGEVATQTYSFNKHPLTSKKWTGALTKTAEITPATEAQTSFLKKFANKQEATKAMLDKRVYTTVTVSTAGRSTGQAVNDVLASAFTAGKQAMVGTLLSEGAKRTLRKYAAKSARIVRKNKQDLPSSIAPQAIEEAVIQAPKVDKAVKEAKTTAPAAPVPTPKTVAEQIKLPVLADTAPTTNVIREVAKSANTGEAKTIKTILDNVDKAAKKAKVTAIAQIDNVEKVKNLLSAARDSHVNAVSKMDKNVFASIKDAITRKDGASPFSFYRYFIDSVNPEHVKVAKAAGGVALVDTNGAKLSLAQAAAKYTDKTMPEELIKQAAQIFQDTFLTLGTAKGLSAYRYQELSKLLGKDAADAFKATGALDPTKTTDQAALKQLIDGLPQPGTASKKTYGNFDELIYGLKNGDIVSTDSLLAIIKALDPEAKLQAQVDKAMAQDPYTGLKNLITRQVKSVTQMRTALGELNPETMFKVTGASMADDAKIYWEARVKNEIPPLPDAMRYGKQAAANVLGEINPTRVNDAATGISRAMDYEFAELQDQGLTVLEITKRGDVVARSISGKMTAQSKAKRYLETNENFGTKLASVFAGRLTWRSNKAFERAMKKDQKFVPINRLDELAGMMQVSDNVLLTTVGTRMIVKKQAALLAKDEVAHYVYLHVGDFADAALDTAKFGEEFKTLATKAIFPGTGTKTDGISFTGLMDTIRMTIEGFEKKAMPTHDELVARLMSTGEGQEAWTPAFKAAMPKIADGLATILQREDVIKHFMEIHSAKLLSATEDAIQPALTMTGEIYQILHNAWKANNDAGITSPASRLDTVREYFNQFAYTAHIFDQNFGPAGEAVFKAAASMFVKDGMVGDIRLLPTDVEEWNAFR